MNILVDRRLGMLKPSTVAAAGLTLMALLVGCGGGPGSGNISWRAIIPPKLTGISPTSGPTTGGTTVAITGTDFQKGATVVFGGVPAAKINSVTSTSIEAVTPVHNPGNVDVTVTDPDTASDTLLGAFKFEEGAPTISSALPNSGPVGGGTVVTITGTDFQSGATVTFGQSPATAVVFDRATQLLATTPAHAEGIVDVIVTNPDGQSATVPAGFTFGTVTIGCGTDCGNVGDPYEGGTFDPTGKTALSDCLDPMTAGTSYYLTGNVGADATATCFGLRDGVTLDLRGHTVTGRIYMTGLNGNGITIFNGTVNCNISPTPAACIQVSSSNAYTAKTRVHHVTIHNSNDPGTSGVAAIYFDWGGLDGANLAIEVDHVTGYVQTAATSMRATFLRLSTAKKVDVHHNDLTCNADVKACNLIETIPAAGYENGLIHNNKLTITTNTVAGGLPRAIVISGPDSGSTGAQGWRVYNNVCTANNGRCFRFRQVNDLQVHDNEVLNCANTMEYGCYHFADPSNGTSYVGDAQATIYSETLHLDTGGVGFWLRDGNGWTVRDVTIVGTHGKLGELDTPLQPPPGGPVPTSATFCGIPGASGLDTDSTAQADTTVNIFDTGTWTGAGTINVFSSCP